jgi:hypothetical protein
MHSSRQLLIGTLRSELQFNFLYYFSRWPLAKMQMVASCLLSAV